MLTFRLVWAPVLDTPTLLRWCHSSGEGAANHGWPVSPSLLLSRYINTNHYPPSEAQQPINQPVDQEAAAHPACHCLCSTGSKWWSTNTLIWHKWIFQLPVSQWNISFSNDFILLSYTFLDKYPSFLLLTLERRLLLCLKVIEILLKVLYLELF